MACQHALLLDMQIMLYLPYAHMQSGWHLARLVALTLPAHCKLPPHMDIAPAPPLADRLEQLDRKLTRLLKELRQTKDDNRALVEERRTLRQTIDRQREDARALQAQVKASPLLAGLPAGADGAQLRARIDAYILEIERCISHLTE